MLKIKQLLKIRIILLFWHSMVLGSILFSLTACQRVNLIDQVLITQYEQEAKQNVSEIVRIERAYRLEQNRFSDSVEKLEIVLDTEKYSYQIHKFIQTDLDKYQLSTLDKETIKSLKINEDESFSPPNKLPRISSDILMISAQPKKTGSKTFVGFIFTCIDPTTGGTDCEHESVTFSRLYESEQPSTPLPDKLRIYLPLDYCGFKRGCLREKVPTPEGFRPVEDSN